MIAPEQPRAMIFMNLEKWAMEEAVHHCRQSVHKNQIMTHYVGIPENKIAWH